MSREKQIVKSTDWLIKGYSEEDIARIKVEAIEEAEKEIRNKQIEEMAKLNAIKEMEAVIRSKTVSCESCEFYKNGICDDACELAEDNHKICTDLYNAGYRKQEWISVEERLPEEDGTYITFTNAKGKSEGVIAQSLVTKTIRGNTIRRWEWQTRISPWVVTHWMPLPEAPKI